VSLGLAVTLFTGSDVPPKSQLLGTVAALGLAFVLVNPRISDLRWPDLFAPISFPALYVVFSFMAPAWAHQINGTHFAVDVGGVSQSPNTFGLMAASSLAFAAGCCLVRPRKWVGWSIGEAKLAAEPYLLGFRVCGLAAVAIMLYQTATESLGQRGINQFTSGHSILDVAAPILCVVYVAGVGMTNVHRHALRPFARVDGVIIVALILLPSLLGDRNVADSVVIALGLVLAMAGRLNLLKVAIGVGALLAISILVLAYRSSDADQAHPPSKIDSVLGDLAPAEFSTGVVAVKVPESSPYAYGSTVSASLVRLLPSPVFPLVGVSSAAESQSTASFAFRNLIGYTDPNNGLGFSIPAEGYLNFGFAGMLGACFLYGALLSIAWRRLRRGRSVTALASYVVLVGTLPICMRSDALGLGKGVLYPIFIIALIEWWSRNGRSNSTSYDAPRPIWAATTTGQRRGLE